MPLAFLFSLLLVGCGPRTATVSLSSPCVGSTLSESAFSSFRVQQARLEETATRILEQPILDEGSSRVELPAESSDLSLNGSAQYRDAAGARHVLFVQDKTGFRMWDGFVYSEDGVEPSHRFNQATFIMDAAPVSPGWWWVRVRMGTVVEMNP